MLPALAVSSELFQQLCTKQGGTWFCSWCPRCFGWEIKPTASSKPREEIWAGPNLGPRWAVLAATSTTSPTTSGPGRTGFVHPLYGPVSSGSGPRIDPQQLLAAACRDVWWCHPKKMEIQTSWVYESKRESLKMDWWRPNFWTIQVLTSAYLGVWMKMGYTCIPQREVDCSKSIGRGGIDGDMGMVQKDSAQNRWFKV